VDGVSSLPQSHIEDALKLTADGKISLFELTPLSGGTIYFTQDADVTWRGQLYEGLPCQVSGEESSTEKSPTPRMTIGQENLDLLPFKGLINDGHLDGATLIRKKVLVEDMKADLNVYERTVWRIKRPDSYSRTKISLVLATYSTAHNQTLPFRQYIPPSFPWVDL
jgi:phage-related protein